MAGKKELDSSIGTRIRIARENSSYTQEQLADTIGVTMQFLSDVERGKSGFSVHTLMRLCNALHVSSDYILYGYDQEISALRLEKRLSRLPDEQYQIVSNVFEALLKSFH